MIKKEVIIKKATDLLEKSIKVIKAFVQDLNLPERIKPLNKYVQWEKIRLVYAQAKEIITAFSKEHPKTALFIIACLFSAFSIQFIDKGFALNCFDNVGKTPFHLTAELNPSGWWFLILTALWLVYMAIAGLSLTTEAFEKNLTKAHGVLFVLLSLSLSSAVTLLLNVIIGRYTPAVLLADGIYGFSSFSFNVTETSFPSFGVQSIWAVCMATASLIPAFKKYFYIVALLVTLSMVLTAKTYISDAVIGAYIGVIMFHVAQWVVSEKRENFPLISRK